MTTRPDKYLAIDVETTGFKASDGHRIVEIAGILWCDGVEMARWSFLVNPGRPSDPGALACHGVPDDVLSRARDTSTLLPFIHDEIACRPIVAYNAPFDMGFLRAEYHREKIVFPEPVAIDVMRLFHARFPHVRPYRLTDAASHLGISVPSAHRALADCELCSAVYHALIDRSPEARP